MFDETKAKFKAMKIAIEYQNKSGNDLNNLLADLKEKYKIDDYDWMCISVAFSTLTSRDILKKVGGG